MTTTDHPRILLSCQNAQTHGYWQSALNDPSFVLIDSFPAPEWLDAPEPIGNWSELAVDVICTDMTSLVQRLEQSLACETPAAVGLIVIDPPLVVSAMGSPFEFASNQGRIARLRLPADVDPGVLRLACRLLSDNVRLRRQVHRAGETHQDLARQAMIDPLTELPNRRAWDHELARRISAAEEGQSRLALAIIDLDHFKQVNDEQGHASGDATLRRVARHLRQALRAHDLIARLGGDEFGLLLSDVDRETSRRIVERVRSSLGELPAVESGTPITASAGVATRSQQHPLAEQPLWLAADRALLAAKRAGRNRTVVADDS